MERKDTSPTQGELNTFQHEVISFFTHAVSVISLPKSLGEIYGLLYSTPEPLSLDDIILLLRMSRGSASQGVRWLRDIGAVKVVYQSGVRKDHYTAETELRKLATGFLQDQIVPRLESGKERSKTIRASIDGETLLSNFQKERAVKLHRWVGFGERILPIVKALASRF